MIDFNETPLLWSDIAIGTMDGQLWIEGDAIRFSDFSLKDIPLESLPPDRMGEKVRMLYASVRPKGIADIAIQEGFLKTGGGRLLWIDADARVDFENVSFENAAAIRQLDGACQGCFAVDMQDGSWQVQARYDMSQLWYDQWLVTDLRGNLAYDPNSMQLGSNDLKANFYCADVPCRDDQVSGKLIVSFAPQTPDEYKLELNYNDVDIQKLLMASDHSGERSADGLAAGNLVLVGKLDDLSQPRGKFNANILNMKMRKQSLSGKILTAVQFRHPEDFVFSEIDLSADIRGSELIFDHIRMVGKPLVFHGQGTLNLETRKIAMELASWDRIVRGEDTVLDMLVRGVGSALWKIQVHGTLDMPEVNAVYLSVLKHPLDIFKDSN